jgi:hypothetical protein
MSKHTPGPWHYKSGTRGIFGPEGKAIATLHGTPRGYPNPDREANAHLLVAAPDLLEALRDLVDAITGRLDGETIALHNALAVIKKAEGV